MEHTNIEQMLTLLGTDNLPEDATTMGKQSCWIAPVIMSDEGYPVVVQDGKHEGEDIYDLVSDYGKSLTTISDMVILYTVGWASPVGDGEDDDVAPSKHPKRVRVALIALAMKDGRFGSAVRLGDDTELMIDTSGEGMMKDFTMSTLFA